MKGKAAVTVGIGVPFEIREYEVAPPGPDDVLIDVGLATICGSDLHFWRGEMTGGAGSATRPSILGHEMTGRVAALGANRQRDTLGRPLKEGDRVAYSYFAACGECWACLTGSVACPNRYRGRLGTPVDKPPHFYGAYAEYYYVQPGQWIFKVPDELPDEVVAPVNCALAEVLFGLHEIRVWFGDTVVVQGAGGLGLGAIAVAKDMGAARVIAIDGQPERLKLAREFGADETIGLAEYPTPQERAARVRELTGGVGADVCVEVVGIPAVMQEGLDMLRQAGRYLMIGNIVPNAKAEVVPHDIVRANRTVQGVVVYDAWVIPRALDWLVRVKDKYPFDRLVSHKYPLEQINEAFQQADWSARSGNVTRAALQP